MPSILTLRLEINELNYRGCTQMRDCWRDRSGWTRGFRICDYCTCHCDKTFAKSNKVVNVRYDFSALATKENNITDMSVTLLENRGRLPQMVERVFSETKSSTTTVVHFSQLGAGLKAHLGFPALHQLLLGLQAHLQLGTRTRHCQAIQLQPNTRF